MRKLSLILIVSFLVVSSALMAQTKLHGVVKVAGTETPLPGVKVTLLQQNISTQTNANGEFSFSYIQKGNEEVSFSKDRYFSQIRQIALGENADNTIEVVYLIADPTAEVKNEVVLQMNETAIEKDDTEGSVGGTSLSSSNDVYNSQAGFSFSPMRFRTRGYDQNYESVYINGVEFNGLERGGFSYSSLGGLNDAMKNQDEILGLNPGWFSYGNLASTTNINTKATSYAHGSKASMAYTNRAYKLRAQYTYATGLQSNGWAFAASAVARWADKGIVDGTFYQSIGYFLSAEKVFNEHHSLSLVTFGAPTQRAQQAAVTQEVYYLANSIYYNPYWGYQDGKIRNSRVVKSFDPTAILSHDFKIDKNQRLRTGLGYHYSMYSNSALNFYNAPDPRPDYYRYLPSYQWDGQIGTDGSITGVVNQTAYNSITDLWKNNDTNTTQINWDALYQANYRNNEVDPTGSAKYMLERRHNDLIETMFNSAYENQINKNLKLTAGVDAKYSVGKHYKTVDDLLGGNQWIDIDQFAERDLEGGSLADNTDARIVQNDLRNPNKVVGKNDVFGYNYDINIFKTSAFIQNQWNLSQFDVFYAAKLTYTQFYRYGYMENGRATVLGVQSYGKGKTWFFTDPSVKAGVVYKIDGRNQIQINGLAESRAPLANNSYVSPRIKDTRVSNLSNEKIFSADLGYSFTYPSVRGRVTGFATYSKDGTELNGYYDDSYRTYVNYTMTAVNKSYMGIEAGLNVKLNSAFSVDLAGTVADYHYTDNADGVMSPENGSFEDVSSTVLIKGLKVSTGPQTAGSFKLNYFHPKMWFADITLNYFDNNYIDIAPSRFSETVMALYTTDLQKEKLGSQEKFDGGFLLDASVGKLIYLKNRKSLSINLSANNILNNINLKTGGYQQGRIPWDTSGSTVSNNVYKFPNKYYYAWGFNMFLNVSYKF